MSIVLEKNVFGLEVAVENFVLMQCFESQNNFCNVETYLGRFELPTWDIFEQVTERTLFSKIETQKRILLVLECVTKRHNKRKGTVGHQNVTLNLNMLHFASPGFHKSILGLNLHGEMGTSGSLLDMNNMTETALAEKLNVFKVLNFDVVVTHALTLFVSLIITARLLEMTIERFHFLENLMLDSDEQQPGWNIVLRSCRIFANTTSVHGVRTNERVRRLTRRHIDRLFIFLNHSVFSVDTINRGDR
mmetsp:Transcript_7641/g.15168  ORF Transcript_7641/g.15168 Transcript_7641/m.15168 type:complete len:247 (+) Transcript_7641:1519-2259(+)